MGNLESEEIFIKRTEKECEQSLRLLNRIGRLYNLPLEKFLGPYKDYEDILNPDGQASMTRLEDIFNTSYFDSTEEMLQLLLKWNYIEYLGEKGSLVCKSPYTDYYIQPVLDKYSGFGYVDYLVVSKEVEIKLYAYSREKYKKRDRYNGTFYGMLPKCLSNQKF